MNLPPVNLFGDITPEYSHNSISDKSNGDAKFALGVQNNVFSLDAYIDPTLLDNQTIDMQTLQAGLEGKFNLINSIDLTGFIEPWDVPGKQTYGGTVGWGLMGIEADHYAQVDKSAEERFEVTQSIIIIKKIDIDAKEGLSNKYGKTYKPLLNAHISYPLNKSMSVFVNDMIWIGQNNKFETGIEFNF